MTQLRYQPEKTAVGTAYFYEESNIDGSHMSTIVQYVASEDAFEAFKWTEGEPEATLVTARMDWNRFSIRELRTWKVRKDGERARVAALDQAEGSNQVVIAANLRSQEIGQTVEIDNYPWHSYDFDFASLNVTLPHYVDPPASFSFGTADFVWKAQAPSFQFKGMITVDFVAEEDRHGARCHRYNIDGPGLEHRGGTMWIDKTARHIVDYEIDLPDEPGYESGKLRLVRTEHMKNKAWHEFMQSKIA